MARTSKVTAIRQGEESEMKFLRLALDVKTGKTPFDELLKAVRDPQNARFAVEYEEVLRVSRKDGNDHSNTLSERTGYSVAHAIAWDNPGNTALKLFDHPAVLDLAVAEYIGTGDIRVAVLFSYPPNNVTEPAKTVLALIRDAMVWNYGAYNYSNVGSINELDKKMILAELARE